MSVWIGNYLTRVGAGPEFLNYYCVDCVEYFYTCHDYFAHIE